MQLDNFGQVNLFVGENNCGKTTVLEALFLLCGAKNPMLPITINSLRRLQFISDEILCTFFHNMNYEHPIEIVGEIQDRPGQHKLLIESKKYSETITEPVTSDIIKVTDSETSSLPNCLEFKYSNPTESNGTFTSSIFRKDQKMETKGAGEPLIRALYLSPMVDFEWQKWFGLVQRKKELEKVISFVKKIEPEIEDLRLNEIGLLEVDVGLSKMIPIHSMGGGTVRFLSIALALLNFRDGVVLIDEIDAGLHHTIQAAMWEAIFSWAESLNIQVFSTTHSYECLNAFNQCVKGDLFAGQGKLYRIEREKDIFKSVEIDQEKLTSLLENAWEVR